MGLDFLFADSIDYPDPTATEEKTIPLSQFVKNEDGTYSYVIDGLSPDTVCTVTESNQTVSGYKVTTTMSGTDEGKTDQVTVPKGETKTLSITNAYAIDTVTITVEKQVAGSLGDVNKEFSFTYNYTKYDGTTVTGNFQLKDDGTFEIKDVPIGATLTLTEDATGYTTTAVYGDTQVQKDENGTMTFTINGTDNKITVTNNLDVVPDTGVILDTLPYLLILAVVAVCGVLFFRKRRSRRDD